MTCSTDFTIFQGKTFTRVVRWESLPFVYKAITGITKTAPARITSIAHVVPDSWRVAVVSAAGMHEINASNPPKISEYARATVIDANTVDLNEVNSSEYTTYTSGGYLQYRTPVDMAGYTARMSIRTKIGGTLIVALTSPGDIVIDNTAKTITITISATATAAFTFTSAVYDLELVSAGGVVTRLLAGTITLVREVTT